MKTDPVLGNSQRVFLWAVCAIFTAAGCSDAGRTSVTSPDGQVDVAFFLEQEVPHFKADYKGETFILPSFMGLEFAGRPALDDGFEIASVRHAVVDSTWEPVYGTADRIRNRYNELTVELRERAEPQRTLVLKFRAYDDGLAFRYLLPEQENLTDFSISHERTSFRFASDYRSFAMNRSGFGDNYEGYYRKRRISQIGPDTLIGMPLLLELKNGWAALTESALSGYAGMSLTGSPDHPVTLRTALAPLPGSDSVRVTGSPPLKTPWRTVLLGERAGDLTTSNLVLNLNDPNRIADTSFIRPGQVIWPWWNGRIAGDLPRSGEPGTSVMKYYIDFAAEHGIPALLVDAGWYSLEGEAWSSPEEQDLFTMEETREGHYDIREVINYGRENNVDVHLWVHLVSLRDNAEEVLSTWSDWGAAGIKVDSYGGDDRQTVADIQHITRVAAGHGLVVNFHGAFKPTGWGRTWPNFMTREGVFGLEQSKGAPRPDATHNVTIPYTRMLAGAMDYTPGAFDLDGTAEHPKHVQTTRAHQVAMYVVYYSPLQMLVDYPGAYRAHPDQFQFVLDIPTTWSESLFLGGTPSEDIVMARRNGDTWYAGAMTNNEPRDVVIPLDFLEEGLRYRARILSDAPDAGENPESVTLEERTVTRADTLRARLAGSGGMAVILSPGYD